MRIIKTPRFWIFALLVLVVGGGLCTFAYKKLYAQSGSAVAAAAGDTSTSSRGIQFQTADVIGTINPNVVLALGDNQYPDGTYADYMAYYDPSWGRFKSKTRPVPGNHEYHIAGAAGYFDYFNGVGVQNGIAGERGKGYYSFNIGSWHMIALNSEVMSTTQNAWLDADLNANKNTACILAYWHSPRFSSSAVHGSNTKTAPFWDLLYKYGADLILNGHVHNYERFGTQSPSGAADATKGIREFVAGTGGAGLYAFGAPVPNSQIRILDHGVLKLTLNATSYDWQFLSATGQVLDSGNGNCVGGGGPGPTGNPTPIPTPTPRNTPTPAGKTPTPKPKTPTPSPLGSGQAKTGDVNGDGSVNIIDIGILIDNYGKKPIPNPKADINKDGVVNIIDIGLIIDNYGK